MGAPPAKGQEWLASTSVGGASGGGATSGGASGGVTAGGTATGGGTDLNSLIQQLQTAVAALQSALEGAGLLGPGGTPISGGGGSAPASGCGCGAGMVQQSPDQVGGAFGGVEAARPDKTKKKSKKQGGSESTSQAAQGASGPGAAPSGFKLVNPLQGARVSSDFGPRSSGNHSGYDLAKAQGSTIVAAAPGKVIKNVSLKDSYGNYIDIDHGNGWVTRYAHMVGKSPLPVGATVNAGQPIGKVGSTGNSTGPHLHFEVIKNGTKLDPEPFLKGTKTF